MFQRILSSMCDSHIFVKLKRVMGALGTVPSTVVGGEIVAGAGRGISSFLLKSVWLPDDRNIPPPTREGFAVSRDCFASLKVCTFVEVVCLDRAAIVLCSGLTLDEGSSRHADEDIVLEESGCRNSLSLMSLSCFPSSWVAIFASRWRSALESSSTISIGTRLRLVAGAGAVAERKVP